MAATQKVTNGQPSLRRSCLARTADLAIKKIARRRSFFVVHHHACMAGARSFEHRRVALELVPEASKIPRCPSPPFTIARIKH